MLENRLRQAMKKGQLGKGHEISFFLLHMARSQLVMQTKSQVLHVFLCCSQNLVLVSYVRVQQRWGSSYDGFCHGAHGVGQYNHAKLWKNNFVSVKS